MLGASMDALWHLTHADCRPFVFLPAWNILLRAHDLS